MENNPSTSSGSSKTSAKDFFLHLGAIVGLYATVISFVNLAFKIINKSFPEVGSSVYAWGGGSEISMPVATLIVFFPLFILLTRYVNKIYMQNPAKKEIWVRKWLTYITLFVAGIILAIDLVTVIYKFLDGQDLTAAFLLKALTVLVVAGCVFGYYLQDIRDRVSSKARRLWAIIVAVIILVFIILGFGILGSPKEQRFLRQDAQKVSNLQEIQWQVINYWQTYGSIPETLPNIPLDPQTGNPYVYKRTGNMTFQLCAEFNRESPYGDNVRVPEVAYPLKGVMPNDNWEHSAGLQCFDRKIDPIAYPTQIRG